MEKKKKLQIDTSAKHMSHLPNKVHLAACMEGGRIQRNRKKYTRKEKHRVDYRKYDS